MSLNVFNITKNKPSLRKTKLKIKLLRKKTLKHKNKYISQKKKLKIGGYIPGQGAAKVYKLAGPNAGTASKSAAVLGALTLGALEIAVSPITVPVTAMAGWLKRRAERKKQKLLELQEANGILKVYKIPNFTEEIDDYINIIALRLDTEIAKGRYKGVDPSNFAKKYGLTDDEAKMLNNFPSMPGLFKTLSTIDEQTVRDLIKKFRENKGNPDKLNAAFDELRTLHDTITQNQLDSTDAEKQANKVVVEVETEKQATAAAIAAGTAVPSGGISQTQNISITLLAPQGTAPAPAAPVAPAETVKPAAAPEQPEAVTPVTPAAAARPARPAQGVSNLSYNHQNRYSRLNTQNPQPPPKEEYNRLNRSVVPAAPAESKYQTNVNPHAQSYLDLVPTLQSLKPSSIAVNPTYQRVTLPKDRGYHEVADEGDYLTVNTSAPASEKPNGD
jgi:hypothetical protein